MEFFAEWLYRLCEKIALWLEPADDDKRRQKIFLKHFLQRRGKIPGVFLRADVGFIPHNKNARF